MQCVFFFIGSLLRALCNHMHILMPLAPMIMMIGLLWLAFVISFCTFLGSSLVWKTKKHETIFRSMQSQDFTLLLLPLHDCLVTLANRGSCSFYYFTHYSSLWQEMLYRLPSDSTKHELTKHINTDALFTSSYIKTKTISLYYLLSELQVADLFKIKPIHLLFYLNSRLLIRLEFVGVLLHILYTEI